MLTAENMCMCVNRCNHVYIDVYFQVCMYYVCMYVLEYECLYIYVLVLVYYAMCDVCVHVAMYMFLYYLVL